MTGEVELLCREAVLLEGGECGFVGSAAGSNVLNPWTQRLRSGEQTGRDVLRLGGRPWFPQHEALAGPRLTPSHGQSCPPERRSERLRRAAGRPPRTSGQGQAGSCSSDSAPSLATSTFPYAAGAALKKQDKKTTTKKMPKMTRSAATRARNRDDLGRETVTVCEPDVRA